MYMFSMKFLTEIPLSFNSLHNCEHTYFDNYVTLTLVKNMIC